MEAKCLSDHAPAVNRPKSWCGGGGRDFQTKMLKIYTRYFRPEWLKKCVFFFVFVFFFLFILAKMAKKHILLL